MTTLVIRVEFSDEADFTALRDDVLQAVDESVAAFRDVLDGDVEVHWETEE